MSNIKAFIMIFLLFNLSYCLNDLKNTFKQNGYKSHCKKNGEEATFTLTGEWSNPTTIPNSLNFNLVFNEGKNLSCSFNINTTQEIRCPNAKTKINSEVKDQFMDPNEEYYLKSNGAKINYSCSSLYLYINLAISFIILVILF